MFIIPIPKKFEIKEEKIKAVSFSLNVDSDEIKEFASFLDKNGETQVKFLKNEALKDEEYKITVDNNGILAEYGEIVGAFRATATLKQITTQNENGELNCLEIYDKPDFKNRGYMLDVSRSKIPNTDYLKSLVDLMADLKYNQLQLYMDNLIYEYKNFLDYVKDTDPYTRAEIEELDAYCQKKFISLVPNQNGFGHMGAWTSKKELSHLAITGKNGKPSGTLNPLKKESLELVDKIYDGFLDAFQADIVNICLDEPFELGLNETKEVCEKYGVGRVYTDYLKKICELVTTKYKKTPMFFDDIIFKHEEEIANIPKIAIVMQWGYETEHHYDRHCRKLQENGLRFYVCPGSSMWGSTLGRMNNAITNIENAPENGQYYGAEGFLLTEWGDGGHPQFPASSYFPLAYGATMSWNVGDHNNEWAYFERRTNLEYTRKYLDKYVYKVQNDISLADIVYRLGNYYLVEDMLKFNGTELFHYLYNMNEITPEKRKGFERVKKYVSELKEELSKVKADEIMLREIKNNCDIVIYIADLLSNENKTPDINEKERILKEFEALWLMKNRRSGMNNFGEVLKRLEA